MFLINIFIRRRPKDMDVHRRIKEALIDHSRNLRELQIRKS